MAKRKREAVEDASKTPNGKARRVVEVSKPATATHIHLITGSYERALHGIIATIPVSILDASNTLPLDHKNGNANSEDPEGQGQKKVSNGITISGAASTKGSKSLSEADLDEVTFADSFLFNAHTSSIRCLALSQIPKPGDAQQKVILATGSTDERINLYHISPSPPVSKKGSVSLPSLSSSGASISQNPRNRELGSLLHHSSSITALYFPTRSKLLSAAEDNTIAVSRTRDWNVLSTIKAPIPKPVGRPSGDTAAPGEVPAGVNDFAVHPSMKLMLSVGKGEKSMRLWNLVTGKKAGVLNFDRDVLQQVGEGKYGTGEGRRILWDAAGEEFSVGFERGACVYDIESKPKARICPSPLTKVHQMHYVPGIEQNILAVSTEDGRILFYDTSPAPSMQEDMAGTDEKHTKLRSIPEAVLLAQLGGKNVDLATRIKDFEILSLPQEDGQPAKSIVVTAGSDGTVRIWFLLLNELLLEREGEEAVPQVGQVLAKYETGNRITCLKAFVMTDNGTDETKESEEEFKGLSDGGSSSESDDSD
jgi:protein MAK11